MEKSPAFWTACHLAFDTPKMDRNPKLRRLAYDIANMLSTVAISTARHREAEEDLLASLQMHSLPGAHCSGPLMPIDG